MCSGCVWLLRLSNFQISVLPSAGSASMRAGSYVLPLIVHWLRPLFQLLSSVNVRVLLAADVGMRVTVRSVDGIELASVSSRATSKRMRSTAALPLQLVL